MVRGCIAVVVFAWIGLAACDAPSVRAAPIMKLNLGGDGADDVAFEYGQFSTIDDGIDSTTGQQNTAIEFMDFLDPFADITGSQASFSLSGLTPTGDSTTFSGWLVEQDFVAGSMSIFAPDNTLLLSADVSISAVTGPLGAPGLQGLFLGLADVTGGMMAPYLDADSLSIRMKLPSINSGGGFSVSPPPGLPAPDQHLAPLNSFSAGATVEIRGEPIPEPSALAVWAVGAAFVACRRRKTRA
jgi:hypothetical protein